MKDAIPGVDWVVYWSEGKLEYDFMLDSAIQISSIQLEWAGLPIKLHSSGTVHAKYKSLSWSQGLPRFFAGLQEIPGTLVPLSATRTGFRMSATAITGPLRIDPVIELAGLFGAEAGESVVLANNEFILGTTRSSSWEANGVRSGSDVFLRIHNGGNAYRTIIWGGTGDEELVPAAAPAIPGIFVRSQSIATGWTNSRDLPMPLTPSGQPWAYGGGDTDGLMITVANQSIFAATLSTEHSEKILSAYGELSNNLYMAGEITLAGSIDSSAFFLKRSGAVDILWTGGGSKRDRIRSITQPDPKVERFLFAAETESDDIPGSFLPWSSRGGGKDVWLGLLDFSRSTPSLLWQSLYGAAADEEVAGLIVLPGRGIFLAGTTSSDNLPLTNPAQPKYGGGPSDAFIIKLNEAGDSILASTYWGGTGEERIHHVSQLVGDLLLSGSSDSAELPAAGISLNPHQGGADAIVALFDSSARLYWAYRNGGPGFDEMTYAAQPEDSSPLVTGGATSDPAWVHQSNPILLLDPGGSGGELDAFYLRIRTPLLSAPKQILGQNLQTTVKLDSLIDSSFSGTIEVSSADPELLQISFFNLPGAESFPSLFIYNFGRQISSSQATKSAFNIHSMGRLGSTEILLRAANLPDRRIPVEIVPSYLFSRQNPGPYVMQVGETRSFQTDIAPLDPNTQLPLTPQIPRVGFVPLIEFEPSDPSAFLFLPNIDPAAYANTIVELRKEGNFQLVPRSPSFATAGNQAIRISSPKPVSSIDSQSKFFAPSGLTWSHYVSSAGGLTTITSEDPALLLVSRFNGEAGAPSITLTPSIINNRFYVQTAGRSGRTRIRVIAASGYEAIIEVIVIPAEARINMPVIVVQNGYGRVGVSFNPNAPNGIPDSEGFQMASLAEFPLAPLVRAVIQCDQSGAIDGQVTSFEFRFPKLGKSQCSIKLSEQYFPSTILSGEIRILAAGISWPGPEVLIPEGTTFTLTLNPLLPADQLASQRISYSSPGVAEFVSPTNGTATELSFSRSSSILIRALGKAGQTTAIRFENPLLAGLQIPVRIIPTVLSTRYSQFRANRNNSSLILQIAGLDRGRIVEGSYFTNERLVLAASSSDPSVCSINATIQYNSYLGGVYRCTNFGETTFTFTPTMPSPSIPPVSVRVINRVNPLELAFTTPPILLSPSFQIPWKQFTFQLGSTVRIRSLDPDLVRIATSSDRAGSASITIETPSSGFTNPNGYFLQAGPRTGETRIIVESSFAPPVEYPVQVVAASLVFDHPYSAYGRTQQTEFFLNPSDAGGRLLLNLSASPIDPFSGETPIAQGYNSYFNYLNPDADPFFVRLANSDPEILTVEGPTPLLATSWNQIRVSTLPRSTGVALIDVIQPEGMKATPASRIKVTVRRPGFAFDSVLYLGAGLQRPSSLRLSGNSAAPPGTTITTVHPEILLLSASSSAIGSASIAVPANQVFYIQAITTDPNIARAAIRVEAPGYTSQVFDVFLEPVTLRWSDYVPSDIRWTYGYNSSVSLYAGLSSSLSRSRSANLLFLPDRFPEIRVRSSDPSIVSLPDGPLTSSFKNSTSIELPVNVRNIGEVSLEVSSGQGILNETQPRKLIISPRNFSTSQDLAIGRGLVASFELSLFGSQRPTIRFTIQPGAGFTIGESAATATATDLLITPQADSRVRIFVAAESNATFSTLKVSAPFYVDAEVKISAKEPQFSIETFRIQNPVPLTQGTLNIPIVLPQAWGPIAPAPTLRLASSDPKVATFEFPTLAWRAGDSSRTATLKLIGAGSTILTIEALSQKFEFLITVR